MNLAEMKEAGGIARGVELIQAGYRGNAIYQALAKIFAPSRWNSVRALGQAVFAAVRAGAAFVAGKLLSIDDMPVDPFGPRAAYTGYGTGRLEARVKYNYRDQKSHRRVYKSINVYGDSVAELEARIKELPDYLVNRVLFGLAERYEGRLPSARNIKVDVVSIVRRG